MALKDFRGVMLLPMPVWDLPTRLFHLALIADVVGCFATGCMHLAAAHRLCGIALVALLLFRLAWGVVGSDTARLGAMLHGPAAILAELRQFTTRARDSRIGHGPIGGALAAIMLALLAVQAGSGLAQGGAALHTRLAAILLGVIVLHLLVVLAYAVLRRQDLVRPMITGRKRLPAATVAPRMTSAWLALVIVVVAAGLAWFLAAWMV